MSQRHLQTKLDHLLSSLFSLIILIVVVVVVVVVIIIIIIIIVNNQLDAQFFFMYVYFHSLHVSDSYVSIIRRVNCINATSGICHSENK